MFLAGATSDAYLFRVIELFNGTLVINELERINTDLQAQITVILNNGYERGMPIGRVEGEIKREPRTFNVFCPKIITTRKRFEDRALQSRIITVPMQPTDRKDIPSFLLDGFWQEAQELRNKLLMYRFKHADDFFYEQLTGEKKEEKLNFLEPRLKQTFLPLLYVISDSFVEDEFISFLKEYQGQVINERSLELKGLVAEKLYQLYKKSDGRVNVKEVTELVNMDIENEKSKLTSHKVGKIIREELSFKTDKSTGGLYFVQFTEERIQHLICHYGLESPLTPPSPLPDSDSKEDLVDIVEFPEKKEEVSNSEQKQDIVSVAERIFNHKAE